MLGEREIRLMVSDNRGDRGTIGISLQHKPELDTKDTQTYEANLEGMRYTATIRPR